MIDVAKMYSISEANKRGISGCVKDCDKDGVLMLKRDGVPVAMLVPLSLAGAGRFINIFEKMISEDIESNDVPVELKEYADSILSFMNFMKLQIEKKLPGASRLET